LNWSFKQPLINYLERLTATQELITNEIIMNHSPPPGLKLIQN